MTGTGYSTTDYGSWGSFAIGMFFIVMFLGGCAGSTSCGIKMFRLHVLIVMTVAQIRRLYQPHGVFVVRYNSRAVPPSASGSVVSFLFLFLVTFLVLTFALSATGLDFITAASGAGTALANVGPGLGEIIGPAGTFQPLSDTAKWLLAFGMLIGRLELFAVLVLLSPGFWRA
ncbi:MAG: potassium transporter TrkG, partial [Sphingomonadales bacterium]